jgi:hypothetical protein
MKSTGSGDMSIKPGYIDMFDRQVDAIDTMANPRERV